MLERIKELTSRNESFAFETTLSTRSYVNLVQLAQENGYHVTLLFLILDSIELATERVSIRVKEGGHNIPVDVIRRRYTNGLKNLFQLYMPIVDKWMVVNNSSDKFQFIAEGSKSGIVVRNQDKWEFLKDTYNGK